MPRPTLPPPPSRRRLRAAAMTLATAVAVLLLGGCTSSNQAKMVDLVNRSRSARHLAPVHANDQAMRKAQAWAAHMARTGVVEHTGGGSRMDTSGLPRWCAVGENVGEATSIQHVHDLWMASAPHQANILGRFDRIGTGVVRKGDQVFAIQIFYRSC